MVDRPDPAEVVHPRLDERVVEILSEHPGRIAFNGLRRLLRAHPESLTRVLRRLERDGVVVREDGGYALGAEADPAVERVLEPARAPRSVASVSLPPGSRAEDVLGRLAGRWFGHLRWFGVYDRPSDPWLVWSVPESQGHVFLSARRGALRVLVDRPRGDPRSDGLEEAAHDLLLHCLTTLRQGTRTTDLRVAEFGQDLPGVVAWDN